MKEKNSSKTDLKSLTLEELTAEVTALGEKPFRARQLYQWMHQKLARDYEEMTNLPKAFRETLQERYAFTAHTLVERRVSKLDGTEKYLFGLKDGNVIESVLMRYQFGNSVCISSQVGCRMGCRFCASTIGGLTRNLLPSEMLDQIYAIQRLTGERVSHVVVMGTGEPLDNYDNLLRFLRLLTDEHGLHISQRNITVSTCGLTERIRQLAEEKLQITLALSLHAPSQEKRKELMPVASKYELSEVLDACRYYFEQTGRRVTFEYSLVSGVNASAEEARELARLLDGMNCHINLIPVNPVRERKYVQPDRREILAFKNVLEKCGKTVTIRREMGRDIAGACGQLRKGYMEKSEQANL
ncbi:MAG: 23S rRNA (adenine(2503)-C(2))-methyltransferase RlmN [Lachnospiraceae bacterium]|nr:23S rRNA (adenine(2503)-C(2))-methyltransferase RlmN [Lachnospiraceae bacterium]